MDNVTKIAFQYAKNNSLEFNESVSEKGVLTFTEDKIIMGTGNSSIEYKTFNKADYFNKDEILEIIKNNSDETSQDYYNKSEVDSKIVEVKTSGTVDLGNYYNKQQIDVRLESLVTEDENKASVNYKGDTDTVDTLNQIVDPKLGDMYTVTATKDNYVYSGTEWIKLSGIVDLSDYYTKSEVDQIKDSKADLTNVYQKNEIDTKLEEKAVKSEVEAAIEAKLDKSEISKYFNKDEINSKLDEKLNKADSYSKTNVDTLLDAKANSVDVYNKTEVNEFLANIYKKNETYTKVETVDLLAEKANQDTTYTKVETNFEIDNYKFKVLNDTESYIADKIYKVNVSGEKHLVIAKENGSNFDSSTVLSDSKFIILSNKSDLLLKADKSSVYTKVEVDKKLAAINTGGGSSSSGTPTIDAYLKSEIDEKFENYYNKSEIDDKLGKINTGGSTSQPDLSNYATKDELATYALKTELSTYATKKELESYSKKDEADGKYALKSELTNKVTSEQVDQKITQKITELNIADIQSKLQQLEQKNQELEAEIEKLKQANGGGAGA